MSAARAPATAPRTGALVQLRDVTVRLSTPTGPAPVLLDVDLELRRGEIVGLVGESGSGKSMTARTIMRALPAGAQVEGDVLFDGEPVPEGGRRLRELRAHRTAMVFQEPRAYVDPLYRVEDHITEGIRAAGTHTRAQARERALELLEQVGIRDGERRLRQYPGELSGGLLQRVAIAGALAGDPDLLIADESTTALDVTTQAEIVKILTRLRDERGLSVLFITHDLALAAEVCDRVCVMYAGRIVEDQGGTGVFEDPRHPYTHALLAARPSLDARAEAGLEVIPGRPTSAFAAPPGCSFHPRCPFADDAAGCRTVVPPLAPVSGVPVACLRSEYAREHFDAEARA